MCVYVINVCFIIRTSTRVSCYSPLQIDTAIHIHLSARPVSICLTRNRLAFYVGVPASSYEPAALFPSWFPPPLSKLPQTRRPSPPSAFLSSSRLDSSPHRSTFCLSLCFISSNHDLRSLLRPPNYARNLDPHRIHH